VEAHVGWYHTNTLEPAAIVVEVDAATGLRVRPQAVLVIAVPPVLVFICEPMIPEAAVPHWVVLR